MPSAPTRAEDQPSPGDSGEPRPAAEAWRDPDRPVDQRLDDLLAHLSVSEQIALLHQSGPGLPDLGIRPFRTGTEALHGVAWLGLATVFPQAVGLGATWNPELLERVGTVASTEVRAKRAEDPKVSLNVWAPVVNQLRDPRWGRNEEGYSEDPVMTARLAIAYCRGLRGDHPDVIRTAPVLKHFQAYNNEDARDRTSSGMRARVLHEYELPVFADPIRAGVVDGLMPAYNLVNGRPAHLSPYLNQYLRPLSGHELLVVSDAQAPDNLVTTQHYFTDHAEGHAAALRAGVDSFTEYADDPGPTIAALTRALERGLIDPGDIARAVRRLFALRLRTGEFDPDLDPYAGIGPESLDRPEHRDLARESAREQVVLLKNAGDLLPLTPGPQSRIAVVGPFAGMLCADWYAGTMPYRVTVADGLRTAAVPAAVVSVDGVDRITLVARSAAVSIADVENPRLSLASTDSTSAAAAQFDVFDWGEGLISLRWPENQRFVSVPLGDSTDLVADQVQPHGWETQETFTPVQLDGDLDGGAVALRHVGTGRFVVVDAGTGWLAAAGHSIDDAEPFRFQPVHHGLDQVRAALEDTDTAVVVVGNDPHINGRETQDRTTLALPPAQEALVRAVAAACPRTVLVVMSSYPYALTWADEHVPAIVWTSHAGQETGNALADVLLGGHSPTGRLPQTWYRSDDDLPDILDYDIIKARRTYQYFEGEVLYPFGHGLSYTGFEYGPARISRDERTVTVSLDVTNTGLRPGTEVVQCYTRAAGPVVDRPRRRLQTWDRIALEPGQTRPVELEFPLAGLAHWDVDAHELRVEGGPYEVLVGRSSADLRSRADLVVPGPPPSPRRVIGIDLSAADFDDYSGVTIVDTTRENGDAVETPGPGGRLLFRDADLGTGALGTRAARLTVRVSREQPEPAELELRIDAADGPVLATLAVPFTGDRYSWAEVGVDVDVETDGRDGVHNLHLLLSGPFRLDRFRLDVARSSG